MIFAALILGFTLASSRYAVLLSVLFSAATACGYGLMADFSDLLFGFWGTAALVLIPLFAFLAMFLRRFVPARSWHWLAVELLLFGLIYPCVAGLDSDRQTLYFNLCALVFMAFAAIQLAQRLSPGGKAKAEQPATAPVAELAVPFVPGAASTS